jgi:hypothetical protein
MNGILHQLHALRFHIIYFSIKQFTFSDHFREPTVFQTILENQLTIQALIYLLTSAKINIA